MRLCRSTHCWESSNSHTCSQRRAGGLTCCKHHLKWQGRQNKPRELHFCEGVCARRLREAASACGASAAQDMMRWKGGVPGTMMLTMYVNGALLALQEWRPT